MIQAGESGADGMGVLSSAIGSLESVRDGHETASAGKTKHVKELLPAVLDDIQARIDGESREWIPTPWRWVNITRGGAAIIAARPGKGKSAFLENLAKHMAVAHNEPTCMVSLEMSDKMLAERALSGESGVQTMSATVITKGEMEALRAAGKRLCDAPFYIADMPGATADEVIVEMRRIHRKHGVHTFCIDYIQDIGSANNDEAKNPKLRIDNALTKFDVFRKRLAKSCGAPITHVFAAQSDREADKLTAREMRMSLLSGSSQLEKIAFHVMFLGPCEKTVPTDDVLVMEANVVKNRMGNTGYFELAFHKKITKWTDV